MNEHKESSSDVPKTPDTDKNAVVEFHAATVAVKEKIGKFAVTIWRHGNLEPQVRVRYGVLIYQQQESKDID